MVLRKKGLLGWVAVPNIIMFQYVLPIVAPLIDLIFLLGVVDYCVNQHSYHQEGNVSLLVKMAIGCIVFMLVDFIA